MSTIVKADANGAVTLPADLCRAAGVTPGSAVAADVNDGRIIITPPGQSVGERIAAMARALPPGTLDDLPDDLASQHDHYLYGAPKR
jgi:antitoxin component of MazEF toxin-antitoxin module